MEARSAGCLSSRSNEDALICCTSESSRLRRWLKLRIKKSASLHNRRYWMM